MRICNSCLMARVETEGILTHGHYYKDRGGFYAIRYLQSRCEDCGQNEQCVFRPDLKAKTNQQESHDE